MRRISTTVALVFGMAIATPSFAQDDSAARLEDVRVEVAEAIAAIEAYAEARRDEAVAEARASLRALDLAIAVLQREAREDWAEMTQELRDETDARLAAMQSALLDMAQRVGALHAGADTAWDELTLGLVASWMTLSGAIDAALAVMDRDD